MASLRYVLCDVFSDRPLCGNALAVFTRATGLETAQMQAIAREMALSETAFIQPPQQGGHARLRIFTPRHEVSVAGHSVLGAAVVLGGPLQAERVRLEVGRGLLEVQLEREGARIVFGWLGLPQPKHVVFTQETQLPDAIGVQPHSPVELYDSGFKQLLIELASYEAVAAVRPRYARLANLGAEVFGVFAGRDNAYKLRVFAPALGIDEDPASASTAGLLAHHLAHHGRLSCGTTLSISQGEELERPARLYAKVPGTSDAVDHLLVGGAAVVIGRGEIVI